ncbi:uncharacterized protein LOC125614797 [Marmota marmota marmota]|uniref:uncharacterized protein LOC125614797 n=1 Tax=Marmota marmota marmota TaxID=9994 RepID=UPI0020921F9E|nr:uncharacterized protein LOC125614797 [Marmota marmota marmota]
MGSTPRVWRTRANPRQEARGNQVRVPPVGGDRSGALGETLIRRGLGVQRLLPSAQASSFFRRSFRASVGSQELWTPPECILRWTRRPSQQDWRAAPSRSGSCQGRTLLGQGSKEEAKSHRFLSSAQEEAAALAPPPRNPKPASQGPDNATPSGAPVMKVWSPRPLVVVILVRVLFLLPLQATMGLAKAADSGFRPFCTGLLEAA